VHPLRRYECRCKNQKMGWFWVVNGHSRSWAMSPFNRAHTTSYSTLIEAMRQSCTVFEIYRAICRKSPVLTYPTCIWHPRMGWPRSNFAEIFRFWKIDSLGYCVALLVCSYVEPFSSNTDSWQTQTHCHSIYRTGIASRGKKRQTVKHHRRNSNKFQRD